METQMTDGIANVKRMIEDLDNRIKTAKRRLSLNAPAGYYLVIASGEMVVVDCGGVEVSRRFKLAPSGVDVGFAFASPQRALQASIVWNSCLGDEQRRAGCSVEMRSLRDYLNRAISHWEQMRALLTLAL